MATQTTSLIEASDEDFAALLCGADELPCGLRVPEGGVDTHAHLTFLRDVAQELAEANLPFWFIAADAEIVGLISAKGIPADGRVEIGYCVAPGRRERGHATRAVGDVLDTMREWGSVNLVVAETLPENLPSQKVLLNNGFLRNGERVDADGDGVFVWERRLS